MNGILVINKPVGYTSRDVVNKVSKLLNTKKIGHTGTLDPIASGVLVLCIGKGLKLVELLTSDEKVYEAKVVLGYETDTLDVTGKTIYKCDNFNISKNDIIRSLEKFVGNIEQEVPLYSAVSVNGKRLYKYAREGSDVELPKREVYIDYIELISDVVGNEFYIRCKVSKGTYIRSLIRDIGRDLGVYATMSELVRIKQGNFSLSDAYSIDDISNNNYKIINIEDAIDIPKMVVDDEFAFKIRNGQVLDKFFDDEMVMILNKNKELLAIYKNVLDKARVFKMF